MAYEFKPYPAVRYHRAGHNVIVKSQAEHDELVAESPTDWAHSPAAFANETAEETPAPAPSAHDLFVAGIAKKARRK